MKLYTVWNNNLTGIRPSQKCLKNSDGDFVGIETGNVYQATTHYASEQYTARIKAVDEINETGMYHLDAEWSDDGEENAKSLKSKFVGCIVTVEAAHMAGERKIYRCLELDGEYFSDTELELLEDDSYAWRHYKTADSQQSLD